MWGRKGGLGTCVGRERRFRDMCGEGREGNIVYLCLHGDGMLPYHVI